MAELTPYQDQLLQTVDKLFEIRHELFTQVINLSMIGDMKEINDTFEEGEEFQFELESFEDSTDANVNLLVGMVKQIQNVHDSVCNLNSIAYNSEEHQYYFEKESE
jgi:hypothetical protein